MTNLNIKLHHGLVNSTPKQRAAAQTLGLNKIGKTVNIPVRAWATGQPVNFVYEPAQGVAA